jgi:psiF repeat-containing protein
MKIRATMAALALGVALSATFAATPAFADNSQQSKMTTCNAQAAGKKGDDRKAFMKDCLSSAPAAATPMTQQQKMTACNKSATGKKGDDRKAFMKDCLSSKS